MKTDAKRSPRLRFVVTAGPTREHLDPVRFLSNPSTGKMGFAIAAAAARRGYDVTLVAGPVSLATPKGVRRVDVTSARDMLAAVREAVAPAKTAAQRDATVVISAAAIADWRPAHASARKLKKGEMSDTLHLVRNPDILKTLDALRAKRHLALRLVGFAAETNDVAAEARRKCREKGLDFIVANDVTERGCGFGTDTNRVAFHWHDGAVEHLPLMSKTRVAARIVRACEKPTG